MLVERVYLEYRRVGESVPCVQIPLTDSIYYVQAILTLSICSWQISAGLYVNLIKSEAPSWEPAPTVFPTSFAYSSTVTMLVETLVLLVTLLTFYVFRIYLQYRRARESVGCVQISLFVWIPDWNVSTNDDRDILTFVTFFDHDHILGNVFNTSSRLVLGHYNLWLRKHDCECDVAFKKDWLIWVVPVSITVYEPIGWDISAVVSTPTILRRPDTLLNQPRYHYGRALL